MEDWKKELQDLVHREQQQRRDQAARAIENSVIRELNRKKAIAFVNGPLQRAFEELAKGLREQGLRAFHRIDDSGTTIAIEVQRQGRSRTDIHEFRYAIDVAYEASGITPQARGPGVRPHRIQRDGQPLPHDQITTDDIIADFMLAYRTTFRE